MRMTVVSDPVALREPAHQVSPRAVTYWRVSALIGAVVLWIIAIAVYTFALPDRPWWATAILVVALVAPLAHVMVMPQLRYRIHRWEVTPAAIYTRSGWLSIDSRVAPLSRVQTVDSTQGALMRAFRLASLTVTTASAAGPITIDCLDREVARRLVHELTEITGASEGDAT
jgi:membrane protein YdbS with pleckstrin-like domain